MLSLDAKVLIALYAHEGVVPIAITILCASRNDECTSLTVIISKPSLGSLVIGMFLWLGPIFYILGLGLLARGYLGRPRILSVVANACQAP